MLCEWQEKSHSPPWTQTGLAQGNMGNASLVNRECTKLTLYPFHCLTQGFICCHPSLPAVSMVGVTEEEIGSQMEALA